jgi:hypothetical protein
MYIDEHDRYGGTALAWAIESSSHVAIDILLARTAMTEYLYSPIIGFPDKLDLSANLDVLNDDSIFCPDYHGQRAAGRPRKVIPLVRAMEKADEKTVTLLLERSANADYLDPDARTPLSHAAETGCDVLLGRLLSTGRVNVNAKDIWGRTPLSYAAESGSGAAVKTLLSVDNILVDLRDKHGATPLLYAARKGAEDVVALLLATGRVDIESMDEEGQTPLSYAEEHEGIKKLLRQPQ